MTIPTRKAGRGHPTAERAAAIGVAVVDATLRAFADQGGEFHMDEVARLAGVSKQAIYRRWGGKYDLLIEAIDTVLNDEFQPPVDSMRDAVTGLRDVAWTRFDDEFELSNRVAIFIQAEGLRDDRLRQSIVQWRERYLAIYERYLAAIDAEDRRVAGDIAVQAAILGDLLSGAATRLILEQKSTEADRERAFRSGWNAFLRVAVKQEP